MRNVLLGLVVAGVCAAGGSAEAGGTLLAWPQFRGVEGAGVADQEKPPVEVGPDRNVKWKVPVPSGFSSPIVVGEMLVLTAFDAGKLFTIAYRRQDGAELWRREAPAVKIETFHKTEGSPAASTPVTDGERIVSYFGSCGLFCHDLAGRELWRLEMPTAETMFHFGTGVSPVLVDGVVILVRDERADSKILAVDAATGKLLWETKRQSRSSHSTPAIWSQPEGKQVVAPGVGRMIGYDLKTGREEWWVKGMPAMCCTTPVIGQDRLYHAAWSPGEDEPLPDFDTILTQAGDQDRGYLTFEGNEKTPMKGFFESNDANSDGKITREEWAEILKYLEGTQNSALALRGGGRGDITATHVVWRKSKAKGLPYVPSAILYRGQCVTVKDGGIVTAYDTETGNEIYIKRGAAGGRYYASPVAANGHIYFTSLDDGAITVIRAGGKTPEAVAKNPPLGERVAATPAIAENTLYVRTEGHLYAFTEQGR